MVKPYQMYLTRSGGMTSMMFTLLAAAQALRTLSLLNIAVDPNATRWLRQYPIR